MTAERPFETAFAHHLAGRLWDAEALYRLLIAQKGAEAPAARNNLLGLLRDAARWPEYEAELRAALADEPRNARFAYLLGCHLLAEGRWAEGWPLYEARRALGGAVAPALPIPEWDGGLLERLLVWPEQGFGDMIQFARYLPVLARRGVQATLLCQPPLARLFRRAGLEAVAATPGAQIPNAGAWAFAGSLPRLLGASHDPPPPLALHGEGTARGGIGVAPRGFAGHANDAERSLPPEAAAALLALPGALSLLPEDTGAADFQASADIVAGLDAVVAVDTAVAHLAASLGKPTFVLLPARNSDWRWMRERADSPWYPSARLVRQAAPGDWSAALAGLQAAL